MTILTAVITSALVSAVVSQSLILLGQHLERKSREELARLERESREENQRLDRDIKVNDLLLSKAIELALTRQDFVKDLAIASKRDAIFHDVVINAKTYYRDLQLLIDTGEISEVTRIRDEVGSQKLKNKG